MRQPGPLQLRGEHIANLYGEWIKKASFGPLSGDLHPKEMRKIAAWLIKAADWLENLPKDSK